MRAEARMNRNTCLFFRESDRIESSPANSFVLQYLVLSVLVHRFFGSAERKSKYLDSTKGKRHLIYVRIINFPKFSV